MSDQGTAAAPDSSEATRSARRRGRGLRWLGGGVAALLLLAAAAVGFVWWLLHSPAGTGWLLERVPQIDVVAPQGSLIGDFTAERLDVTVPGSGVLRLDAPRWQGLRVARGRDGRWLHIVIDSLHANRVTWLPEAQASPAAEPARAPQSLRLPLELEVRAASVDELRVGSADATPIRAVRGRVHLGAERGTRHRLQELAARVDRGTATGSLEIGADAPFPVDARARVDSVDLTPPWHADLSAQGPLEALNATAAARVQPTATHPTQSLDARAVVRPFAAWPLGELRASVNALDLSAFASAAPATSLSGEASATTSGSNVPATLKAEMTNARAGRWNEGLLPVQRFRAEVRARPDDPSVIEVQALDAELGSAKVPGGRMVGRGRWTADRWELTAELAKVRPAALDARAPVTALDGKAVVVGSGFAGGPEARVVDVKTELAGDLADPRLPRSAPRRAQLRLDAQYTPNRIEIRAAQARAGDARASLAGQLRRADEAAPWQATGRFELARFDPSLWWPGAIDSLLGDGPSRLNGQGELDLILPAAAPADAPLAIVAATRGRAALTITDSVLAGVALAGQASYANDDGRARPSLDVVAGGNRLKAHGRLAAAGSAGDEWQLAVDAPRLATLAPWLAAPRSGPAGGRSARPALSGTLTARARLAGRWPDVTSDGELQGGDLRLQDSSARRVDGRWRVGSAANAPLEGTLTIDDLDLAGRRVERAQATLAGSARAHRAELQVLSAALPPEWIDALAARTATAGSPSAPVATATPSARSVVRLVADGGLVDAAGVQAAGWRGSIGEIVARSVAAPVRTWLSARDVRGSVFWSGGPLRATLEPGSAQALGATVRWSRLEWQAGDARSAARLDVRATVDAFPVAPVLKTFQPTFGWGGDLSVTARVDVRSAPDVRVDAVVERRGGDLTVSDELGTQALGLTDLRLGVAAEGGVWHFTTAAAGGTLGVVAGAVTARTTAQTAWPDAATPIDGVLELRVANLGTWGPWVPAGWRLSGDLHASSSIGGRLGAPQYTGRLEGSNLGVRNFLEGVNVSDGRVAIALQGTTARIEQFIARAGEGTVRLEGNATFDETPTARLRLVAERFEMLGRVDRRIVTSGAATLRLDAKTLALDGQFKVDEGLVDFTRSDAPRLGDDVVVVRRPAAASAPTAPAAVQTASPAPALPGAQPASRTVALDLRVGMGERMRVRGRGLDAGLRGELHITSPNGRLAVEGTLSAVDGTYQAYGQKLAIARGILTFVGPVENPRLDILAVRPDLDVRVGVTVGGTALNPRIRLFSEPEMSDLDKLSWLVLGREAATTGGADTALLQQAALALLSGEGPGVTDRLIQSIGLDTVGIRQSEGAVKDTIVSLGKQISKRWYVGYEHGLNTTTGTWQLIYRVAQRVTIRAQAGGDNAIDINWTVRWR
ncbi:MAG TPA: translocation/assembly module TamB domain-containing protein [Caldimonas sp.]|jgi:translocation and assembly module TamB|nr:translocation/assembly module TamB domain-containing protein [Caldimonas sp.]HEX2539958.1 translocation/assembly module TamB domain-containing protein [Caldimonas sp.]